MGIKIETRIYTARKQGMNVDAGTTVNSLRNMLCTVNHDAASAHARVYRDGDIYIGRLNNFLLKEGDIVEFNTENWSDKPAANYNHQSTGARCTCNGGCARAARPAAAPQPEKKPTTIEELWDKLADELDDIKSDISALEDETSTLNDNVEELQSDMANAIDRIQDLENAGR